MSPDRAAAIDRIAADELARVARLTVRLERSNHVAWRWWAVLISDGNPLRAELCMTRRGAERKGKAMIEHERLAVTAALQMLRAGVDR